MTNNNNHYTNPYNSPSDCRDVCQGLFLFETQDDGIKCCENSRAIDRPTVPELGGPNSTTIPWKSCFGHGPAQQYISYFYGTEAAEQKYDPPLGPFPGGTGSDCDYTTKEAGPTTTMHDAYLMIGGIVGGMAIIVVLFLLLHCKRKKEEKEKKKNHHHQQHLDQFKKQTDEPAKETAQEIGRVTSDEIIVSSTQGDSISTLGEPMAMFTHHNNTIITPTTPEQEDTVGSLDYDYQVDQIIITQQQQQLEQGGESSIRISELQKQQQQQQNYLLDCNNNSRGSSSDFSNTPTSLFNSKNQEESLFFDDDASFERQFINQMEGERIEVMAPAGKLGMVVDTPNGGVPVVHALKSKSILNGKVMVGDRLISVDDEDTTEYTAIQVSKLISEKENQPQRALTFVRTTKVALSNRTASLENIVVEKDEQHRFA